MAYLNELNSIVNISTSMILQNQNICKLLYYYPKNVDFQYNPLSQPNIKNTNKLLLEKIYPMPKMPDAETEQVCFIDVNIAGGSPMNQNTGFRRVDLVFDVVCHLDSWIIKGGFRPLKILSEIDFMFNDRKTNLPIENKPQISLFTPKNYSNKFYGYQLRYELIVNSNIDCGV